MNTPSIINALSCGIRLGRARILISDAHIMDYAGVVLPICNRMRGLSRRLRRQNRVMNQFTCAMDKRPF